MNAIFSKYKLVLLPLLLVMLFDVSLLAMNYYIASQLDATSTNINIAGRQRMLSQKITKAIVVIHYQIHNNNEIDKLKFLLLGPLCCFFLKNCSD
jgi:nitrate/nitrite-specific signal transduction histidine kinase